MTQIAPTDFTFALAMRPGESARAAAAWFIAGAEQAGWIAEMVRWEVSLADARVYVLPRGLGDPTPCGAMVVLGEGTPKVLAAIAYARLGRRLYFPAEAMLDPAISAEEADAALRWEVNVLHPSAALVGFAASDGLAIDALLAGPVRREADWNHASAGIAPRPRLTSVVPEAVLNIAEILQMVRDDIGSNPTDELPAAEDEHPVEDAMGDFGKSVLRPIYSKLVRMLAGDKDGKWSGPARYMARKLREWDESLSSRRKRELNRLLELLRKDPDEGLKFALPLRDIPTRGMAPPGTTLGPRNVDFNLSSLSGGNRKSDPWNVGPDLHRQLRANYLESANRELRLGRFRRAAYIFAELLGDFAAAADALRRGRHFRESATIYQQKLNNPKAAADCLAEGGLLLEAIPLYRQLSLYETAAELYEKIGRPEEAAQCYREAVGRMKERGDFAAAAKLLENKLAAPDEALDLLESTWPMFGTAGQCLREWFGLCGRLGRTDRALRRVEGLRTGSTTEAKYLVLVEALAFSAKAYPEATGAAALADATRVLAGNRLPTAFGAERQAIVAAITSLVPGDRLLARDGNRFLGAAADRPTPAPRTGRIFAKVSRSFSLPGDHQWQEVVSTSGGFLALGGALGHYKLARGRWKGTIQYATALRSAYANSHILISPGDTGKAPIAAIGPGGASAIGPFAFAPTDVFERDLEVRTPRYFDDAVRGACRAESGMIWVLSGTDFLDMTLAAHGFPDGSVLSKRSIALHDPGAWIVDSAVPMVSRNGKVYLAWENRVTVVHPDGRTTHTDFPATIRGLAACPPFTVPRVIVTFDEGWALIADDNATRRSGEGLTLPVATFLPSGQIVVVGENEGRVYNTTSLAIATLGSFPTPSTAPLTVLHTDTLSFAVFYPGGKVDVY